MNYTIEAILVKYPKVNIGVLVGNGLKNSKANLELERYKRDSLRIILEKVGDAPVSQHLLQTRLDPVEGLFPGGRREIAHLVAHQGGGKPGGGVDEVHLETAPYA